MMFVKAYKFRLKPTKKQARLLQEQLDECRWLYNELLAQRKLAHEELDFSLSKYNQNMLLPFLKEERLSLAKVHSQVLQNVVDRLDKAFQHFFRRCKAGETPGFPRFDVGLTSFATFSDGREVKNPQFFKQAEKQLAKAQRKLEKLEKGTAERRKQKKAVAKIYEKTANQRKDFCHKESRKIVNQYQYICAEDLSINKMMQGPLAKSIADASWSQFLQCLSYKAAEAGRKLGLVNPAYTTQDCSQCGYRQAKKLVQNLTPASFASLPRL